jgi:tRNA pseudouridine38-40 synthase
MKYRITLAYDGTEYSGWQIQLGQTTIQGLLNAALDKLEGSPVTTFAAGRTDAGVHAEGQIVSFRLAKIWSGEQLRKALNGNLPPDIRVLEAAPANEDFHARFDAKGKIYRYRIFTGEVMNPFWVRYAWHYPYRLNQEKLAADAQTFIGTHDFTAFTVAGCEVKTRVRTVTDVQIEREADLLTLYFSGEGFLRYQVRTMVGALIEANRGRLKAGSIAELIESRDRALMGAPAPAQGLTLLKVEY